MSSVVDLPGMDNVCVRHMRGERNLPRRRRDMHRWDHVQPVCCNVLAALHLPGESLVSGNIDLRDGADVHRFADMQRHQDMSGSADM
jgi:hypothetical protein